MGKTRGRTAQRWLWVLLAASLFALLRRRAQRWGATAAEARGPWPGDVIIPDPTLWTTHAVTVHVPPERVWPWVVQMGYYRGGWYTDADWWDALPDRYLRALVRREEKESGRGHRDRPSAERIVSEFQDLKVGDVILDGPPGTAFFTVAALEPGRLLALHSTTHLRYLFPAAIRDNPRWGVGGEFCWNFILAARGEHATRLILRTRGHARPWLYRLFLDVFLPLVDWALARKLLTGVKRRAERPVA